MDEDCEQLENDEIVNSPCISQDDGYNDLPLQNKSEISNTNDSDEVISPRTLNQCNENFSSPMKNHVNFIGKENKQHQNVNITPGAIMLTPKARSVGPTPDRSVSNQLH